MVEITGEIISKVAEGVVLVGAIVLNRVLTRVERRKPPSHARVEELHPANQRIYGALDAVMYTTGADRVYVSQYRNGVMLDSGNPLMKKCRTHERCRGGVSQQVEEYREVLFSRIPEEFALVMAAGHSWTPVLALPQGQLRSMCQSEGTKAIARVAIRRGANIVGFVGADYGGDVEPVNMDELEKQAGIVALELASTAAKP